MIILPLNLPSISQVKQVKQIPCELFPIFSYHQSPPSLLIWIALIIQKGRAEEEGCPSRCCRISPSPIHGNTRTKRFNATQ